MSASKVSLDRLANFASLCCWPPACLSFVSWVSGARLVFSGGLPSKSLATFESLASVEVILASEECLVSSAGLSSAS